MDNKEKELEEQKKIISDGIEHSFNAASTGDCTGLIPSGNVDGAELESYRELYDFLVPEFANEKKEK